MITFLTLIIAFLLLFIWLQQKQVRLYQKRAMDAQHQSRMYWNQLSQYRSDEFITAIKNEGLERQNQTLKKLIANN